MIKPHTHGHTWRRNFARETSDFRGNRERPAIAAVFDIDFVIFTARLDGSHERRASGSLTGGCALNGFRRSLSVPRCNVTARTVRAYCRAGRLCLLEMDVSVIIRVILKLETALEPSVSFKGGIPPACIDYRHFQLDKTFPQSPADCGGTSALLFGEVHRRRGGLRRPNGSRRFRRRRDSVLTDLRVSLLFCFSLLPHFHL